jgi:hypothetical protein
MLGIGNALVKQAHWSPNFISDLIGWWDFTDIGVMHQEIDGSFTTPTTNNDPIGTIKNKSTHTDRLGAYLYAESDDGRPNLRYHPSWAHFTAQFDGGDEYLLAEEDGGTVTGGTTGSVLSTATIDLQNYTAVVVCQPNSATPATDETIFTLGGDSSDTSGEFVSLTFKHETSSGADDNDFQHLVSHESSTTNMSITSSANIATAVNVFMVRATESGGNRCRLYLNGTLDVTQGTWESSEAITFTEDHSAICIGTGYRFTHGAVLNTYFAGNVFEVLFYNKTLTDAEVTDLNNYLVSKYHYGITT